MRVSPEALREVREAFDEYSARMDQLVASGDYEENTRNTYVGRAYYFVQFMEDGLMPGERERGVR